MTSDRLRLQIRLDGQELTEWANLAKRCGVSRQMLGAQAIRQLARSARGATAQLRPLLSSAERSALGAGEAIFIGAADAAELASIAARYDAQPERVAIAAVRFMLEDARGGVLPMVRPMQAASTSVDSRYETFSVENAAENNFNKARDIIDHLLKTRGDGPHS